MTVADRAALLADLLAFPDRLRTAALVAVAGRPPPAAGEWGPAEVIRHLIAVEAEVHQARLEELATIDDPQWDWTEPGPWPGEPGLSVDELLDRFAGLRAATIRVAERLDDAGWARTGTHSRLGRWDVAGLLRNAITHDEEHLRGLTE
jgi:hypothetical protein